MSAILWTLVFTGCKSFKDASFIIGRNYACLFDTTLECQLVDVRDGEESRWGEEQPPARRFESVSGSYYHLCGISVDGESHCWGSNEGGRADIPPGIEVSEFFVGYANSCAIDGEGYLTCWGDESTGINDAPEGPFDIVAVAEDFGCAWGEVSGWSCWGAAWGMEEFGGDRYDWSFPDYRPVSLKASRSNICMIGSRGRLYCWGSDSNGVNDTPRREKWRKLSVGADRACAFDVNHQLDCWGSGGNDHWLAGRWVTFTAGPNVDCGIRASGEIDCWGCLQVDPMTCDWDD